MPSGTLVIVESPAKCNKIESFLGPGYTCMASFGHIRELTGLTSIDIQNGFKQSFTAMSSKQKQIASLKKAAKSATEVIIATDDDREGEAIGWHLCVVLGIPVATTKRIIFNEITKPALQKAVSNPTVLNTNLISAQQARQTIDMLVGYMVSPVLWDQIARKSKKGLSAGRCQTPALRLIYENQKEIDASPGEKAYNTTGFFTSLSLPYVLDKHWTKESDVMNFLEESVNYDHLFDCSKPRDATKKPPQPFSTSALQQMSSNELRYSPKDTMRLCQTLYEGGYITYMRTDSRIYSKEFVKAAHKYVTKKYGAEYVGQKSSDSETTGVKPTKKKVKKVPVAAQEAHEAIRPTDVERVVLPDSLGPKEKKMYKLIWRNTVESCMAEAKYKGITTTITAPFDTKYKYCAEQVVFPGWRIVGTPELRGQVDPTYANLRSIETGSIIEYHRVTSKSVLKNLKQHYTEAKLVQLLEEKGIGRPSTFSSLVDKVQSREYVKKEDIKGKKIICSEFELIDDEITIENVEREFGNEKGKLVVQPLGVMVIELLIRSFGELFSYDFTSEMEAQLDAIAKGITQYPVVCGDCHENVTKYIKSSPSGKRKEDIQIDKHHKFMIGRYGPVVKRTQGEDTSFVPIRKDIDMDRLRAGGYTMDELRVDPSMKGRRLGEWKGEEVVLKKGKFGLYVTWGDKSRSLKDMTMGEINITLDDVQPYLDDTVNPAILRALDDSTSIRNGKYGHYIYYKTAKMKKPRFLPIKDYTGDYIEDSRDDLLEWIHEKHQLS